MPISKAEWEELYIHSMEPLPWWMEVHHHSRALSNLPAPMHCRAVLLVPEHYHAYYFADENLDNVKWLDNRIFIGFPNDDSSIAPEPMLYMVRDFNHDIRGRRDFAWVFTSEERMTRHQEEVFIHAVITAQRINPFQPSYSRSAANAARGFLSQEEYSRFLMSTGPATQARRNKSWRNII